MSGTGASIRCDSCGHVISSDTLSEAELRHTLMAERGWVCAEPLSTDGPLDACELEECQDRIVGMVP